MPKTNRGRSGKSAKRREELRRNLPKPALELRSLFEKPELIKLWLVILAFVLTTSAIVVWSRQQIKVRDGRVMTDTRLKRLDYDVANPVATERDRETARRAGPQVWRLNSEYLDSVARALDELPASLAGLTAATELDAIRREQFRIETDEQLAAFAPFIVDGQTAQRWKTAVTNLVQTQLPANPLLMSAEYQAFTGPRDPASRRLLAQADDRRDELTAFPIELAAGAQSGEVTGRIQQLVIRADFPADISEAIVARLLWQPQSTLLLDRETTDRLADEAAALVDEVVDQHRRGEVIYQRGDTLTGPQYNALLTEAQMFAELAPWRDRWLPRIGVIGLMSIIGILIGAFVMLAYPKVTHNALRLIAVSVLMAGMLALSVTVTAQAPNWIIPAAIAPTLAVAIILLLAYDQRLAMFLSGLQAAMVVLALEGGIGLFVLIVAGAVTMVSQLREVRHRSSLTRAAMVTGVMLLFGTTLLGLVETPFASGVAQAAARQIAIDAGTAAVSALVVGVLLLGILPSIERWFDITTGMTLAELRDPKQPLLRQLQQKAPGTYNHSLQVANVAEAAAEAIGANGLLVYVGAMYHDIGKMNKPGYFVENQAEGFNKHEKLSPAMSLLVIIGHVKDGVELAREYNLPRQILHFIESHHGTTLVEYFYHAAKTQAEQDDKSSVEEVEFRYPGPKPRSKEAAILMLSDAVESATRAMPEPNPGRIESLVRELSRRRLLDGQLDECTLTFRELVTIEDAIISRLCSIYHGRISYPGATRAEDDALAQEQGVRPITA